MDVTSDLIKIFGGAGFGVLAAGWMAQMIIKSALDKDLKAFEQRLKLKADAEIAALSADYRRRADQELAALQDSLQRERERIARAAGADAARAERLRVEVLRWANPIRSAVLDLRSRLDNILARGAYPALQAAPATPPKPGWSIHRDYFLPSTLYLFCQYFHWVRRLELELSFELFVDHAQKDAFVACMIAVSKALGDWSPATAKGPDDRQVFRLQQRALGEAVTVRADGGRCMDYPEFLLEADESPLLEHLAPLSALIDELDPGRHPARWARLLAVQAALDAFLEHTRVLLQLPAAAPAAGARA